MIEGDALVEVHSNEVDVLYDDSLQLLVQLLFAYKALKLMKVVIKEFVVAGIHPPQRENLRERILKIPGDREKLFLDNLRLF